MKFGYFALMIPLLAGCQQAPDPKEEHLARENDSTIVDPPGRYQMMPNPGGEGFIVLDTRTGYARHCAVAPPQTACGPRANIPD